MMLLFIWLSKLLAAFCPVITQMTCVGCFR